MAPRPPTVRLWATTNHDRHVQFLRGMADRDLRRLGSGLVLGGGEYLFRLGQVGLRLKRSALHCPLSTLLHPKLLPRYGH
jgi:hypothetical protein